MGIKTTYNGRDQVTNVRQYSGGTSSSTYQDTTMSYDGHGRPYQLHKPEFNSSTYVTTTYNADDTVATVTDPRGVSTNYFYGHPGIGEKRAVVTGITYSVGSTGIVDPADVGFEYDNAGNRTEMSDGTGTLTYSYDELSRLKTETKDFTDYLADAPSGGVYTVAYTYHLSGELKTITDPFGAVVSYDSDKVGRMTGIGGSGFASYSSYASDIKYRAFGDIKSMKYSTSSVTNISMNYDSALRPTDYEATSTANTGDIQNRSYSYYNDGTIHTSLNNVDAKYTQSYEYDFSARLKKNDFGSSGTSIPYRQNLSYDAFGNITGRSTWDKDDVERSFTAGFTNNRKTSGGYESGTDTFDAAGNITQNQIYSGGTTNLRTWKFDAAGRMTDWVETLPYASTLHDNGSIITFDGDGERAKTVKRFRDRLNGNTTWSDTAEYHVISSVLDSVITDLDSTGKKTKTYVYMGSSIIAEQRVAGSTNLLAYFHVDPVTGSGQETPDSGVIPANDVDHTEVEALGSVVNPPTEELTTPSYEKGSITSPEYGHCAINGVLQPDCKNFDALLASGVGEIGPLDPHTVGKWVNPNGKVEWRFQTGEVMQDDKKRYGQGQRPTLKKGGKRLSKSAAARRRAASIIPTGLPDNEADSSDDDELNAEIERRLKEMAGPAAGPDVGWEFLFDLLPRFLPEDGHCHPRVQSQLKTLRFKRFGMAGRTSTGYEFGFQAQLIDGEYVPGNIIMGEGERIEIPVYEETAIKVHSHPLSRFNLSQQDIDNADAFYKRFGTGYVTYVFSDHGLRLYNPSIPKTAKGKTRTVEASECPKVN